MACLLIHYHRPARAPGHLLLCVRQLLLVVCGCFGFQVTAARPIRLLFPITLGYRHSPGRPRASSARTRLGATNAGSLHPSSSLPRLWRTAQHTTPSDVASLSGTERSAVRSPHIHGTVVLIRVPPRIVRRVFIRCRVSNRREK
jgi:hypothetical protein